MKKVRQFINIIKESFKNLWRNKGMGFASTVSIAAMLTLFGFVLLLILNINTSVYHLGSEIDKVVIYFQDNATTKDVNEIIKQLQDDKRVKYVKYVSKEDALKNFKESFGDKAYILDTLGKDTLPASLTVSLKDLSFTKDFANSYKDANGVLRVDYHYDLITKMMTFEKGIKYVGFAIVFILLFVSMLIIHNTIKITVANRKREIMIMKYIGAENYYIRGPFLIEGIIFGIVGAIIASLIVYYVYAYVYARTNGNMQYIFGMNLTAPNIIKNNLPIIFLCIGVGIGYIGSLISTKKFLDV